MNDLLIGLISALLSTNQVVAASNVVAQTTGIRVPVVDPSDPVEIEYQRLLADDDAAQAEVDDWIRESAAKADDKMDELALPARIKQRFEPVERAYKEFLLRQPGHTRARLAYGSMLSDLGRHDEAVAQWERARELDPQNPATWNNLADHFSHFGDTRKSVEYFARAVELAPREPVYRYNLASAVAAFRPDAQTFYKLPDDAAVLRKAVALYREALAIDPMNFKTATDLAQMFYLLAPEPGRGTTNAVPKAVVDEGLAAWREAERLAADDPQRQGVALHIARFLGMHGRFGEAHAQLARVNEPGLADLKARIRRGIEHKEKAASSDAPPGTPSKPEAN